MLMVGGAEMETVGVSGSCIVGIDGFESGILMLGTDGSESGKMIVETDAVESGKFMVGIEMVDTAFTSIEGVPET
jgi:hypothetical protein